MISRPIWAKLHLTLHLLVRGGMGRILRLVVDGRKRSPAWRNESGGRRQFRPGSFITVRTMGNSDFCHSVAGMPKGASRLNTRAVAIVCDSAYLSRPSGPCLRPTPDIPIPPMGAPRLPPGKA